MDLKPTAATHADTAPFTNLHGSAAVHVHASAFSDPDAAAAHTHVSSFGDANSAAPYSDQPAQFNPAADGHAGVHKHARIDADRYAAPLCDPNKHGDTAASPDPHFLHEHTLVRFACCTLQ